MKKTDFLYTIQNNKIIDIATNKEIKDEKNISRIKGLRIPPGYKNVRININPNAKLQAYGYDKKGRKQFIYHKNFIETQQKNKFNMVVRLHNTFLQIEKEVKRNLKNPALDEKTKLISLIIYLIIVCNFRIGNEKYRKEHKHYGLTTIEWKHVEIMKEKAIKIEFIGKKGVLNISVCSDPYVFNSFKNLKKNSKYSKTVFTYKTIDKTKNNATEIKRISSKDVNDYLKNYHPEITAKSIRVWNANRLFVSYLVEEKSHKKAVERLAKSLHNTPAVCKSSYIHPELLQTNLSKIESKK